ncbi:RNA polymerase factor sigma-54 [Candidatus Sumerlaeota bacterium]|nr:RNA polymerase factor sigma-54 [Candidatus Sumerlaeota bacterium]
MALSLDQVQKQVQRLVMTPQMQQSIKLLQLNSLEMEQLTEQQIRENPFLELAEEEENSTMETALPDAPLTASPPLPDPTNAPPESAEAKPQDIEKQPETFDKVDADWEELYDDAENKVYFQKEAYEEEDFTEYTPKGTSLSEHLLRQLKLSALSGKDIEIGERIIGNLDENGYLRASLEEIAQNQGVPIEQAEDVLDVIQSFDPAGIAARTLAECLRLQLEDQNVRDSKIYILIDDYLEDLQKKKFKEIAKSMGVPREWVMNAFQRISRLEPKPGRQYNKEEAFYITPDVIAKKINGKYLYFLNEGRSSNLRINSYYQQLLNNGRLTKEEKAFALEKYRGAIWYLKNIEKRKLTILRITEAILNSQQEFLEKGIKFLKPLTLREIAEAVEMHESTVARVANGKYVETPRGTYELKYFFSSGLETQNGESTSSKSVKETIARIIQGESPNKPLSDQKIARLLENKGIKIARRTVAKYREQIRILPAKLRKSARIA